MVAIHIPSPAHDDWGPTPHQPGSPRTAEPPARRGRGGAPPPARPLPDRATRLRRRRLALLVVVVLVSVACVLAVRAIGQLAGGGGEGPPGAPPPPPPPPPPAPVPVAGEVYVVQPGDTLWTIATEVAPDRDPRPVVDALRSANDGSATLQVGTRLEVDID
jgi:hypothetical protein